MSRAPDFLPSSSKTTEDRQTFPWGVGGNEIRMNENK